MTSTSLAVTSRLFRRLASLRDQKVVGGRGLRPARSLEAEESLRRRRREERADGYVDGLRGRRTRERPERVT